MPADEVEILRAEQRLQIKLPPSYRAFVSVTNGWRPFGSFIEELLPVQSVERLRDADPESSELIQECYEEDQLTDSDYLDYTTPRRMTAMRTRYYPDSLLVGKAWDGGGCEMVLLNPGTVFPDGEWEAIFFAPWLPGNKRYRTFGELVLDSVSTEERLAEEREKTRS
jgi:hypothetical protein